MGAAQFIVEEERMVVTSFYLASGILWMIFGLFLLLISLLLGGIVDPWGELADQKFKPIINVQAGVSVLVLACACFIAALYMFGVIELH